MKLLHKLTKLYGTTKIIRMGGGRFPTHIEMVIITKPILREFPAVGDGGDEIIRRRLSFPLQLIHIHASVHMGFALQQNILHLSLFAHNPVL